MLKRERRGAGARNRTTARTDGLQPPPAEVGDGLGRDGAHHATIRGGRSPAIAPSTRRTIRCARPCGEVLVVGDQQDRLAAAVEVLEERQGRLAVASVERAGRLVGEEDGRSVDDGAGDRHALAFAAAERCREAAAP